MHRLNSRTTLRRGTLGGLPLFLGAALVTLSEDTVLAADVEIPKLMFRPSVNLVLSVSDTAKSKEFYGEVLRLKPMADLHLPGGLIMTRYQVGTTEIKLLTTRNKLKTETGEFGAAYGIRRLTLFFPDADELRDRFAAHDLEAPQFQPHDGDTRSQSAIVSDPDGNRIELAIPAADASEEAFNNIELGLNVKDLEASRKFYGEFIRFAEIKPEATGNLRPAHSYRHGNTTIRLSSTGSQLPTHSGLWQEAYGLRYIQYIVTDLDAVNDYAKAGGVTIAQEIFPLGKLARIMFIADPDGIINEFVGLPKPQE